MYSDAKRIHLLEKLLQEKDDSVLIRVEQLLEKATDDVAARRPSVMDLVGSIPKDESKRMQDAIDDAFGGVDPT